MKTMCCCEGNSSEKTGILAVNVTSTHTTRADNLQGAIFCLLPTSIHKILVREQEATLHQHS